MNSVWKGNLKCTEFPKLNDDIKTDILIVGGGLAGILTAYFLEQAGVDYALVEAEKVGMGITKNTSAKITLLHSLIYSDLISKYGETRAKQYLMANQTALSEYKKICKGINCDFEEKPAITYSLRDRVKIENEITSLQKLGYKSEFVSKIPLPFNLAGAIKIENQAQFNPLKFLVEVSKKLNIYENTFVEKIKNNIAYTKNGIIKANKIIIATHFPFINTHGSYFMKMYQHRSYVVAIKNAPQIDGMYVDEADNGMSFRNYSNLLLIGGGDHKTGKKGGSYHELRNFIKTYYPNAEEKYHWATQDCITLDKVPYIGRYAKSTKNLFVATGFNKWGMTSSMVSAKIISDLALGKRNEYAEVFSPSRSILQPRLFLNLGSTLINFLYPTIKRCPHLGCALRWNKNERTWDCPCHGSRFDEKGKIIDNPAKKNASI